MLTYNDVCLLQHQVSVDTLAIRLMLCAQVLV